MQLTNWGGGESQNKSPNKGLFISSWKGPVSWMKERGTHSDLGQTSGFTLFLFGCVGSSLLERAFLRLRCGGFSLRPLPLQQSPGPRTRGLRASRLLAHRAQTQPAVVTWAESSMALGSSWVRNRSRVSGPGRWIPSQGATGEAPAIHL